LLQYFQAIQLSPVSSEEKVAHPNEIIAISVIELYCSCVLVELTQMKLNRAYPKKYWCDDYRDRDWNRDFWGKSNGIDI